MDERYFAAFEEQERAAILPLNDALILPYTESYIYVPALGAALRARLEDRTDTVIGLPTRSDGEENRAEDFHSIGVILKLKELRDAEQGALLEVVTGERVRVSDIRREVGYFSCEYQEEPAVRDLDSAMEKQMLDYLKKTVREISEHFRGSEHYIKAMDEIHSVDMLIVWLGRFVPMTAEEKYEYLSTDSLRERSLRFMDTLLKQKEAVDWNIEMNERISDKTNKYYREQMLREQMKAIQQELGEGEGAEKGSAEDYRARIEAAGLPEEIREAALEEVRKLEAQQQGSAETSVIRNYLDFLLKLPWTPAEAEDPDLRRAEEILDEDHYGLEKVKKRIIEHLAVMKLRQDNKGSILLLVGPPGTGKTSLGKSVARALGRKYVRLSLGGIRDESEIRGHRRTYVGAMPGRILNAMTQAGTMNPVMVLDEVDKLMAGGFSGDPSSALLEVLDPEQNDTFTDHYLDLPYDLSQVFFLATANAVDTIPAPLLDRMEVIEISSYTEEEKFHIAKDHLLAEVREDTGLTEEQFQVTDETIRAIIADYTREGGVRGLKKSLMTIARGISAEIVTGRAELPRTVKPEELETLLGKKVSHHDQAQDDNPPGVVTGLAWTPVGGEILFIEAAAMPGSGQVILTGQLGDVMQESARISLSLLKSRLPMAADSSKERDIHIHVPQGAVPKDGPSAGITIFTALASLFSGIKVDPHLAMTGEITLRGAVMPIGGLKEKLLAARRAGIKRALIPRENVVDLKDLPEAVTKEMEVVPVDTIEDVLRETVGITLPKPDKLLFAGADLTGGMLQKTL